MKISGFKHTYINTSNLKHVSMRVICLLSICLERRIRKCLQAQFCFWSQVSSNNMCTNVCWINVETLNSCHVNDPVGIRFTQSSTERKQCSLWIYLEAKGVKEMQLCWFYVGGRFFLWKPCRIIFARENPYTGVAVHQVPTPLLPPCCSEKLGLRMSWLTILRKPWK